MSRVVVGLFLPGSQIQHAGCMSILAQHARVEVVLTRKRVVCDTRRVLFLRRKFNTRCVLTRDVKQHVLRVEPAKKTTRNVC